MSRAVIADGRQVDAWGRVIYSPEAAFELLLSGQDIGKLLLADGPETRQYNATRRHFATPEAAVPTEPDCTPAAEHARRAATWLIPDAYREIDLRSILDEMCDTPAQRARVAEEMDLYEARGLLPMLRAMVALVAHFRANGVVWGVGRGSSVASFVLFLIGVTRIDPTLYGLQITDYLR